MKSQLTKCCDRCKGFGDCSHTIKDHPELLCKCHTPLPTLGSESWEKDFCDKFCTPEFIVQLNAKLKYVDNLAALHEIHDFIGNVISAHRHSLIREISDKYGHFLEPTGDLSSNLSLKEVLTRLDK